MTETSLTIEQMQDYFTRAVEGLASQGFAQSKDGIGGCSYRGTAGRRCALGWLIPDDAYTADMEFADSYGLVLSAIGVPAARCDAYGSPAARWFSGLQDAHDTVDSEHRRYPVGSFSVAEAMKQRLREFAAKWNLDVPAALA